MKMRKITKVYLHYLNSLDNLKGYHFILSEMIITPMSISLASEIDNDIEALHIASLYSEEIPKEATMIVEALDLKCEIQVVNEVTTKKSTKK
jgi:hypothetical protein